MHTIDRRKLMVSGAIGAAALSVAAVPAVASVGADAELKRLWEEWKAQYARWLTADKHTSEVEEKVSNDGWSPYWKLDAIHQSHAMPYEVPEGSLHARFTAFRNGEPVERFEQIEAASVSEPQDKACAKVTAWDEERTRLDRVARRRHKAAAAERARELEHRRLRAIEEQIAETPAEGLAGIAVKMALWQHYNWDMASYRGTEDEALVSAYETVVKMTGVNLATQVERW